MAIRVGTCPVRPVRLTRLMISDKAKRTEERLAKLLELDPPELREYVVEVLEDRLWRGGEKRERRTGITFVRGTHGGSWVRDPEGTDILPPGAQPPP